MSDVDGVVFYTDTMPPDEIVSDALRLEVLGCDSLWLPDLFGRGLFVLAGFPLGATCRIIAMPYDPEPKAGERPWELLEALAPGVG